MKHSFHPIPPGSYNKIATVGYHRWKLMENKVYSPLLLAFIILVLSLNSIGALATPELTVNNYYQPGDTVEVSGTATPGTKVLIEVKNSIRQYINDTTTAEPNGYYSFSFQLDEDVKPDVYRMTINYGDISETGEFRVTTNSLRHITQNLIDMVIKAKNQVEATFERMNENDIEIPEEANRHYTEGVAELEEARTSYEEGDHEAAVEHLKMALTYFKTSLNIVYRNTATYPPEVNEQARIRSRIKTKLQYAKALLDKVPITIRRLEKAGIDTTRFSEAYENAVDEVSAIEGLLLNGQLREAERRIDALIEKIRQFKNYYSQYVNRIKTMLLTKYNENFQTRILRLEDTINKMEHLAPEKADNAISTLNNIKRNLNQVELDIQAGKTEQALTQLKSEAQKLDYALSGLNGREKNLLSSYDRVSTRVDILNTTDSETDLIPDQDTSVQIAKEQLKNILSRLLTNKETSITVPKKLQPNNDTKINGQTSDQSQDNSTDSGSTSVSPTN